MLAVIKTGGKQYRVAEGDKILVELLHVKSAPVPNGSGNAKTPMRIGEEFDFEEVLLVGNAKAQNVKIGQPLVKGAKVRARVLENGKAKKKIIFKFKNKTRYWKKKGHRQPYTKVEILKISAG